MNRILYIILFILLINKSNGQDYHNPHILQAGYIYSQTPKSITLSGFNLGYVSGYFLGNSKDKSCSFNKIEFGWMHNFSANPKDDTQKDIYNMNFGHTISLINFSRLSHIFLDIRLSTGLIKLYNQVSLNTQTNSYDYSLKNKWYAGAHVGFEWIYLNKSSFSTGVFLYGNFHRYIDFGAGINLYYVRKK